MPSTPQSPRDVAPMPIYSSPPPEQIFSTLLSKKDPESLNRQYLGPSDDNRGYQAFPEQPSQICDPRLPDDIPRGSIGEGRW
jgi:hypothetical protein